MAERIIVRHSISRGGNVILQKVSDKMYYVYDATCPNCNHELVTTHRYTGCESCGYVEFPRERSK